MHRLPWREHHLVVVARRPRQLGAALRVHRAVERCVLRWLQEREHRGVNSAEATGCARSIGATCKQPTPKKREKAEGQAEGGGGGERAGAAPATPARKRAK